MRFTKEVNIYAPDAILKRFKANETNFSVLQGKISSLISESEITELRNGGITMYSKLSSVEQTADGLTQKYTDISSKYDAVTKQYSELDSKVAEYKSGVDGLSANISAVSTTLKNDYSTTSAMNAAITANVSSVLTTVSETYATQDRVGKLETWKNQAEQKITADAIVSTVTSSSSWEGKADKATLISQINQTSEKIKIKASIIDLQGNVSITDLSSDAIDTIKGYSLTEVANLEAAGDNLVKGYRFTEDNLKQYWETSGTVGAGVKDPDGGTRATYIYANGTNCYLAAKRSSNQIVNAEGRYCVTFWARSSKAQTIQISFNRVTQNVSLTTSWQKFSFVKDISTVAASGQLLVFGGNNSISTGDGYIYIYKPVVYHGYSSEDILNLLTNNGAIKGMYLTGEQLYWNGTYIKANSITSSALAADSVTADKIKGTDLSSVKANIAGFKMSGNAIYHDTTAGTTTYHDTYFSSANKRLTFRNTADQYMSFSINGIRASSIQGLNLVLTPDLDEEIQSGEHHSMGATNFYGDVYVKTGFRCVGTKQAIRETENYGVKGVYCYETPTPLFGDVGSAEIAEDGRVYIDIDDILKEMINTEMQYFVFLQKRGTGDLYVSECTADYFVVTGTPGLKFFWEIKAKQKGYEYYRYEGEDRNAGFKMIKYDDNYISEIEQLIEEREEA